ncbi:hypothetical protein EQG41_11830 [Billgrantia azerbaijanica]|nr:hypothetical protein EQG41_11830 [Halomonas azerbaijanica]
MNHAESNARIWSTPLDALPAHEIEIKLGLWQHELHDLRHRASELEEQARQLRQEEAKTRGCISCARERLGIKDGPIPDFSREEPGHD